MNILYMISAFFTGLLLGGIFAWLLAKYKQANNNFSISKVELNENYIPKNLFNDSKIELSQKENQLMQINKELSTTLQDNKHLNEKLANQKKEIEDLKNTFKTEFENLANKLFEEKSQKFISINEKNVGDILKPLKEKISDFEKKIDDNYKEEIRERVSLKEELKKIMELNKQVSEDAEKLTKALKGDSKTQGDWGEIQLELILEKAGLVKDIHYQSQENFKSEDGKNLRPDYIINLPDDKKVIIDSKVSLTAYENFFNTENEEDKKNYLKAHLDSINRHINELSAKNYQTLYGINQPDFVLLFVPIEPALLVAVKEDKKIFEKALGKNIVLVSTSTLLATLRTISYIWKQENQKQNVYEIAQESGKLYDKFVGFMEDLVGVGRKIDDAKGSYLSAMNKLISSSKKGDTIVGRMERIKNLGANSSKSLAKNILERVEE